MTHGLRSSRKNAELVLETRPFTQASLSLIVLLHAAAIALAPAPSHCQLNRARSLVRAVAMEPTFASLCRLLHALEARRGRPVSREQREAMLEKFFRIHVPVGTGSAAAVLALLLPTEDDRRYWLKETRLAGALVTALGCDQAHSPTPRDLALAAAAAVRTHCPS